MKPVCAGAAVRGGAAKLPGVGAAVACKETLPKPTPTQLKVPVKPATVVSSPHTWGHPCGYLCTSDREGTRARAPSAPS
eukprot:3110060-Rhodomonas_salina.1